MLPLIKTHNPAKQVIIFCIALFSFTVIHAQPPSPPFRVIAFYTARNDQAHISFVHEANKWFPQMAAKFYI
jgi:hypothetical protein